MKTSRLLVLMLALGILAAACGDDDDAATETSTTITTTTAPPTTTTTTTPATTTTATAAAAEGITFVGADGVESTITDTSRVVSLNGDLTEIIFELGLGANVVGIDVTTTYPEEAAALPQIGFGQRLAAEPVIALQPTLVIGDQQVGPADVLEQIRGAGIPVVILEVQTTLDGIRTKIEQVAEVVGAPEEGAALADRVDGEIEEAVTYAAGSEAQPPTAFVYSQGPQVLLLFGNGTVTQSLIEGANGIDAIAASGVNAVVPLTPEALVAADPEVIITTFGAVGALGGIDGLLQLPGVAETTAAQQDRIYAYDDALILGFGPRVAEALTLLALDLHPELVPVS